ncbi:MAG: YebC/PmpR family DNA-binding transcriptional regulator [Deltaproteobacteria bacterium]|nr:YebC/PmpR family DNA-binding transcriptional regulator [Deltaproteobacteria bacterium]
MSGHSKWSTIKRKKGAADAKRGKAFSKVIKEITVAARMGGGDPSGNPRLRAAVLAAKAENMPKDNIDRAIKKGTGDLDGVAYEETIYEGYGPGGVAILVQVLTDNKNRTVSEVRHIFTKNGGSMGESGSVAWLFDKKGCLVFEKGGVDEEALMEWGLEAGVEDIREQEKEWEVITAPESFEEIRSGLEGKPLVPQSAELTMLPKTTVTLDGKQAEQMLRMMEALEDNDDVQQVYANFDIPDNVLEALG